LKQDRLIVDELGFAPFDGAGGEMLFHVLSEGYERRASLVTTHLAFSEWPRVFGNDEKLAAALLDGLAHHAEALVTPGGPSLVHGAVDAANWGCSPCHSTQRRPRSVGCPGSVSVGRNQEEDALEPHPSRRWQMVDT